MGQAVGPSGMRADNIKVWKRELTHEKDPDTRRWEKLVSVTKLVFREGCILTALSWTMMVLITNIGGRYIGIGLVEVVWKVWEKIMNNRLRATITLHGALHCFKKGRGKGTATMEAKLAQHLVGLVHDRSSRFY